MRKITENQVILEEMKNGSQLAFKKLFDKLNRKFFYIVKENFDLNPLDIEEVVSTSWYIIWKKRQMFESEKHLDNYMRKVLYSKALKRLSKDKRAIKLLPMLDLGDIVDEQNTDFEREYQEKIARTIEATKKLPDKMRKVMECVNAGMGAYQTAITLNIKIVNVWSQKSKALEYIRCMVNGLPPKLKRKSRAKKNQLTF